MQKVRRKQKSEKKNNNNRRTETLVYNTTMLYIGCIIITSLCVYRLFKRDSLPMRSVCGKQLLVTEAAQPAERIEMLGVYHSLANCVRLYRLISVYALSHSTHHTPHTHTNAFSHHRRHERILSPQSSH